ncbi:LytTR family transcriptional regulator DNA-binding domain-containing protein [Spirosoma aerolatum]|nr:LytTR family transcriptional regulator DNA-binding domain-containing protein [Spirosoma aerolatum]
MILMSRTLKGFEKRWPSFVRVHKHALINSQHAFRVK